MCSSLNCPPGYVFLFSSCTTKPKSNPELASSPTCIPTGAVCTRLRLRSAPTLTASHSPLLLPPPPITGASTLRRRVCLPPPNPPARSRLTRTSLLSSLAEAENPADSVCSRVCVLGQTLGALPRRIRTLERGPIVLEPRVKL